MTKPLPQLRLQKRCACGQFAVTAKTVRRYRAQSRLDPLWAAHFLPRADMRPAPPLCVHHMIRYLAGLYGARVRNTFWGDQLSRRRRNETAWRHSGPCHAHRSNGSPCCARAIKHGFDFLGYHSVQRVPGAAKQLMTNFIEETSRPL